MTVKNSDTIYKQSIIDCLVSFRDISTPLKGCGYKVAMNVSGVSFPVISDITLSTRLISKLYPLSRRVM